MPALPFDVSVLGIICGLAIPLVTAFVTRMEASAGVKSIVTLALAAIAGFFGAWQLDNHYDWRQGLLAWTLSFIVAVAAHAGLWGSGANGHTGIGLTGDSGLIQRKMPGGLG
jgi:hypothetical protein